MMPPVAEFLPSSLLEWGDRLSAAVILQGCNFRCPFCHSAKMVPVDPHPEDEVPWDVVEAGLADRGGWLDGVVVSGGEPTIHADLGGMLERLRALDLPVKLDTNGSAPEALRGLVEAELLEHVAVDVKALLEPGEPDDYARATGREDALAKVRETLDYLKALDGGAVSYELRTTVVPGFLDDDRGSDGPLLALARELAWADKWYLQGFRPVGCLDPEYEKLPATDPNWLAAVAEKCREIAPGCRVRGG
ncbi:MAG: anaerobic ribonucleoside-triphosphate reductase activating protein [Planctomycetota bacterium]|jgi:pyruvate formate lyase activating enzyme